MSDADQVSMDALAGADAAIQAARIQAEAAVAAAQIQSDAMIAAGNLSAIATIAAGIGALIAGVAAYFGARMQAQTIYRIEREKTEARSQAFKTLARSTLGSLTFQLDIWNDQVEAVVDWAREQRHRHAPLVRISLPAEFERKNWENHALLGLPIVHAIHRLASAIAEYKEFADRHNYEIRCDGIEDEHQIFYDRPNSEELLAEINREQEPVIREAFGPQPVDADSDEPDRYISSADKYWTLFSGVYRAAYDLVDMMDSQ